MQQIVFTGYFLKFLNENNIYAEGVEFDINTVTEAKKNSSLNTMLVKEFNTTKRITAETTNINTRKKILDLTFLVNMKLSNYLNN